MKKKIVIFLILSIFIVLFVYISNFIIKQNKNFQKKNLVNNFYIKNLNKTKDNIEKATNSKKSNINNNVINNDENIIENNSQNINNFNDIEKFINSKNESNLKNNNNFYFKFNNNNVIGIIEIEQINYKGLIFEGTSSQSLKYGIGHFESSPLFQGNICLAGHNYKNIWSELHKLKIGDIIKYNSKLGTKKYKIFINKEINYNDTSVLNNTKDNIITLITCVKNTPDKRTCIQAKEFF